MTLPGNPAGAARNPGAPGDARQLLGTLGTVGAIAVFVLILVVSLFGGDGEPKQVIKIDTPAPAAPSVAAATPEADPKPMDAGLSALSLVSAKGFAVSDPALIEMTTDGPLPKIAGDGRKPMTVYAGTFDRASPRAKIAIVVGGLGLGDAVGDAAIERLPPGVTLSVTPAGTALQALVTKARASGHEVLLETPLEPNGYPNDDPGIDTLLTGETASDNPARLKRVLGKVTGYAGLIGVEGSKFLASEDDVKTLLQTASSRGLYFLENGEAERSVARKIATRESAPFVRGDLVIDRNPTREAIEQQLAALEVIAKQRGSAVGVAGALPVTIDRVTAWAQGLKAKGFVLAPASALVETAAAPAATSAPEVAPKPPPRSLPAVRGAEDDTAPTIMPAAHSKSASRTLRPATKKTASARPGKSRVRTTKTRNGWTTTTETWTTEVEGERRSRSKARTKTTPKRTASRVQTLTPVPAATSAPIVLPTNPEPAFPDPAPSEPAHSEPAHSEPTHSEPSAPHP